MFAVRASRGGLQTAIILEGGEVGWVRGRRLTVWNFQLRQNFVNLARLITEPESVAETRVVRLDLLRVHVHRLHVGFGILERVSEHRIA